MKIYQAETSSAAEVPTFPEDMVNKAYVDAQIASGSYAAPLFFTNLSPNGSGIVGQKSYLAGTVPANAVIVEGTTDEDDVTFELMIEPGISIYSPTVTITADVPGDFNGGSPVVLDSTFGLTRPSADRQFVGQFTANVTGDVVLTATSSAGGVATVTVNRAGVGPAIQTLTLSPESAQGAGRTHVKNGDVVTLASGSVENDATTIELISSSDLITSTQSLTLGAPDSAGAGFKTVTGSFTVAGASNGSDRTVTARAANSFGTYGTNFESTNGLDVDNAVPQFSGFNVTYPASQGAIKSGEQASVALTVTDFTSLAYSTPLSQISINGGDTTTYETKVVDYASGSYNITSNNYRVVATKETNGTTNTFNDVVNIVNVAPTAAITIAGNPTRLRSAVGGSNYTVNLNPNQDLLNAPDALTASAGSFGGAWTAGSGDTWNKVINITDATTRGAHTFSAMTITGLSGITGSVITSGAGYSVGGFTARVITVPAFAQAVQLPTSVGDVTKVVASYFEASSLTRQTNLNNVFQGFSFADRVGDDTNALYDDTFPTAFWISDSAFAGSNTTGTLQIEVEEIA